MKIDALIFVLVQVLTTNFQRHLFYIIFTRKTSFFERGFFNEICPCNRIAVKKADRK